VPKFNITAEYGLSTEIEPSFSGYAFDREGIEDLTDSSYFSTVTVEADGGSLSFSVEAEDEAEAERKAEEVVYDGQEIEDNDGLTWLVQDVSITAEAVEMSLSEAIEVIREYIRLQQRNGLLHPRVGEAFDVILVSLDER
jgi:hypothetical protein